MLVVWSTDARNLRAQRSFRSVCHSNEVNDDNDKPRKLSYRKDYHAMRPIYECPENFRESLAMPILPKFLMGFSSDGCYMKYRGTKFEVLSFTSVTCTWDNRGCRMYRLVTMHSVTDRWTDRQTDRQTDKQQYHANSRSRSSNKNEKNVFLWTFCKMSLGYLAWSTLATSVQRLNSTVDWQRRDASSM